MIVQVEKGNRTNSTKLMPAGDILLQAFLFEGVFIVNITERELVSQEQLQREVDYVRAQNILAVMLQHGLISQSECNKITMLNRETFSPALGGIMPGIRC